LTEASNAFRELAKALLADRVDLGSITGAPGSDPRYGPLPKQAKAKEFTGAADAGVATMQDDLIACGFSPWHHNGRVWNRDKDERGIFGPSTERALREFQNYARMPFAGEEKHGTLQPVPNSTVYTGAAHGILDATTAHALAAWAAHQPALQCPVRITAKGSTKPLWGVMDDTLVTHRIWVRDVSGHYQPGVLEYELGQPIKGGAVRFGHAAVSPIDAARAYGAPIPQHANPTGAEAAFAVIAHTALRESGKGLDGINAWDPGVLSLGWCHWTLFLKVPPPAPATAQPSQSHGGVIVAPSRKDCVPAEGPALLTYLAELAPATYDTFFGRFGVGSPPEKGKTRTSWVKKVTHNWAQCKYEMAPWWVQGTVAQGLITTDRVTVPEGRGNDFRTWHWMHRIVQASRDDEVTRVSFEWALRRLRDLMMVRVPGLTYGLRAALLQDLATSEQTAFLLFRVHVNHPRSITKSAGTTGVHQTPMVTRALNAANVNAASLPADVMTWGAEHHAAFRAALVTACGPAQPPPPGGKRNLDEVVVDLKLAAALRETIPGLNRKLKDGVGTFSLP
jgi:hypothetical protein